MGWVLLLWEGVVAKGQASKPRWRWNLLSDSDSIWAQKKPPWTYLTNISPSHHWLWLIRDNPLGFPFLCCKASHLGDCTSSLSLLLDKVKHFSKLFYKNLQSKFDKHSNLLSINPIVLLVGKKLFWAYRTKRSLLAKFAILGTILVLVEPCPMHQSGEC